ncbi:MAG: type II secretion system major pseudopilin GspG [Pseudobdellovibrionaceae bacterium]|jgi:general secretion pathway protein G
MKNLEKYKILSNKGFTLIEIMIVLAILGSIFALIGPRIVGALDKSKVKEARIQLAQVQNALSSYYTDCGAYPTTLEGLTKDLGECKSWGPEAYSKQRAINDPWKNAFVYELSDSEYTLKSLGKDGKEGGTAYNADIMLDE